MDSSTTTAAVNPLGIFEIILLAFFEIYFYLALMQHEQISLWVL
jgi:hypothetical protein